MGGLDAYSLLLAEIGLSLSSRVRPNPDVGKTSYPAIDT
jgi:hypothetical protein